jgi:putative DNA primase/helicase
MQDGVDFDYSPSAVCPTWQWFLNELFPSDEEARNLIEEQLGYGMTVDNQFEKAGLWIGPARSGRGTIAHIQELLVGVNGYTSLDMHTWHKGENSRMGMVGKRVGIFHDVRVKPGQFYGQKWDPGGIDPHSQQLLLELISGDATEIGRKYVEAWKGMPFIKFLLISNKILNFNDDVLITRFNTLEFQKSYLGKERPELKKKILPAEISGIAARCVAAYGRLLRRGHFIQPRTGVALIGKVKAAIDPWTAFMDLYWEVDPTGEGTRCAIFYAAFRHWCLENRRFDLMETSPSDLIQKINRLDDWEFLHSFRPDDKANKRRPRRYLVRLKSNATLPDEILSLPEVTYNV